MNKPSGLIKSSLARKYWMAATGLFLIIFLVAHLAGNFLLLKHDDGEAFLLYSEFMKSNALILIVEVILFASFIFHIIDGLVLTIQNRKARENRYAYSKPSANSSWFSRNMGLTGTIILVFLVIHLRTFFIPYKVLGTAENTLYDGTVEAFSNPFYTGFYVIAMLLLAFHLAHGFQSAFQSLGIRHSRYTPIIKKAGAAFAFLIPLAFAFIPVYIYLRYG